MKPEEARKAFAHACIWLAVVMAVIAAPLGQAVAEPTPRERLAAAQTWGYNLQKLDLAKLNAASHDVLVIDYATDGSDENRLKPADLAKLRVKPDGSRRIVLAYMSIGEAETYRYYWHWTWGGAWYTKLLGLIFAPAWLGPSNSEWSGNYAVRYWDDRWQALIIGPGGYLERIVEAGFDGVYLDKIDSSIEPVASGRSSAVDDMRTFVARIAERGRARRPGFLVVPQNGEELLTDPRYRAVIDGIGKEDLLYGEDADKKPNKEDVIAKRVAWLSLLRADGKPVLAVEYLDDAGTIEAARRRLTGFGFIPHFAGRELEELRQGDLPAGARSAASGSRRWRGQ